MHKNFFLFERLVNEIKPLILGQLIARPFTFQKDELIIPLHNNTFLRFSVSADHPYMLLSSETHVKHPVLELFRDVEMQTIIDMRIKPFDKHIVLELNDFRLEALFYAPYFNVYLFDSEGRERGKFKEKSHFPGAAQTSLLPLVLGHLSREKLHAILCNQKSEKLISFFKKNFVALNKLLLNEIFYRLQYPQETPLENLSEQEISRIVDLLLQLDSEFNAGKTYLYYREKQIERIALLPLTHLEVQPEIHVNVFDSVNTALNIFYRQLTFKQEVIRLKTTCTQALQKRFDYLKNSLQKLEQNADLEARKNEAELKGNLLLTFKTQIPRGAKEVELENIFSEQREKIKIKLNPAKTVIENAQRYFNRFKRLNEEKRLHAIRYDTYQKELNEIEALVKRLSNLNDLTRLKKFAQKLKEMKLLQKTPDEAQKKIPQANLKYAFRRLILDKKWDVFIGKDGANNELLTFRFANKWDIWLHAQGVPGSHVIIRLPRRDQLPPKHVIEQAAQIAAANSKARHSSTVPVMYTQARYVSRMRKAPPGTVKVQNEKVIFVKPMEIK